jgi:hypothetical protein
MYFGLYICISVCTYVLYEGFVCYRFNVTSTQYRSYRDVPALLVEEDLKDEKKISVEVTLLLRKSYVHLNI